MVECYRRRYCSQSLITIDCCSSLPYSALLLIPYVRLLQQFVLGGMWWTFKETLVFFQLLNIGTSTSQIEGAPPFPPSSRWSGARQGLGSGSLAGINIPRSVWKILIASFQLKLKQDILQSHSIGKKTLVLERIELEFPLDWHQEYLFLRSEHTSFVSGLKKERKQKQIVSHANRTLSLLLGLPYQIVFLDGF